MLCALAFIVMAAIPSVLQPQVPKARVGHVLVTAGPAGGILLSGGVLDREAAEPNDTLWHWDGRVWRALSTEGPRARSMAGAAFDTRRGALVLYGGGGMGSGTRFGDTWEWNAGAWQERNVRSPGARDHHAMAYDEARGLTVMFGGRMPDSLVFPNDTWVWNGATWSRIDSLAGPGGRTHHAMVYDAQRQRVVLFGGDAVPQGDSAVVWEWDGSRWLSIPAPDGPGSRSRHRMAYDALHKVTVLFGGQIGSGKEARFPTDTWTWDGTRWEPRNSIGPLPRFVHGMAYDARRQRVMLFGGGKGGPPYNPMDDLWEWDGSEWRVRYWTTDRQQRDRPQTR